ncbi:HAD-IA family hydrolase [Paraburkholderia sp. J94]|uniref:HAD-IA family hydrolase n=1 Tax=Paraburkholderia sp. J94 TaxID=2805441 RepID=UPI002AB1BFE4|nr:HAD-IA family hydrolase [Paraburkholderia sp. J94]
MISINAKSILLDMDGTLIQSIDDVELVWRLWCEFHNINLQDVLKICHGVRSRDVIEKVAPHLDPINEIQRLDNLEIKYSKSICSVIGASDFLSGLGGSPWALVTSASRKVALHRMNFCNLPLPKILISSESVVQGKPSPEPYLNAARRLQMHPQECLVFEDAAAGIESALTAGCKVVQVGMFGPDIPGIEARIADWRQVTLNAQTGSLSVTVASLASRRNIG